MAGMQLASGLGTDTDIGAGCRIKRHMAFACEMFCTGSAGVGL